MFVFVSQSYRDKVGLRHRLTLPLLPVPAGTGLPVQLVTSLQPSLGGMQQPLGLAPRMEGCAGAVCAGSEPCLGQPCSPRVAEGLESGLGRPGPRPSRCCGSVKLSAAGLGELKGPWGTSPWALGESGASGGGCSPEDRSRLPFPRVGCVCQAGELPSRALKSPWGAGSPEQL